MSGGSDSTTVNNSVPDWVKPFATNYMDASQKVAALPYQSYSGQTTAQLNPYQTQGLNAQAQRAVQGSAVNDAASGELQKTLSGGYLNSNPYLNSMVDSTAQDMTRAYNSSVVPQQQALEARSGSFGNAGVQQAIMGQQSDLLRNIGNASAQIRGNDYGQERARMASAVGQAPTIANQDYVDAQALQNAGQGFQQQDQANLTDAYQRFQQAQNYPQQQLATLGRGLGFNFGNTSTSIGPTANRGAQALGAGLAAYGAYNGGGSSSTSSGGGK